MSKIPNFNIGYACLNNDLGRSYKTCRLGTLTEEKWISLVRWNLETLGEMFQYNIDKKIKLLRISSDLIPFASAGIDFIDRVPWENVFEKELGRVREIIDGKIRFSMHPGQYTLINSPREDVVERSILDLEYHSRLLKALGGTSENKMVLHIGGAYGDKAEAISRFKKNTAKLSENIMDHLVIENDHKIFNMEEVLGIGYELGLPVIFDNLHHEINSSLEKEKIVSLARDTWKKEDGNQIIHYSQQALGKALGSHSDTIRVGEFFDYIWKLESPLPDVMLEVKDKNRSAEKINAVKSKSVVDLEKLWAKYKYSVLAKSNSVYNEIRKELKDKNNWDGIKIVSLIEEALSLEPDRGAELNAFEHVWGYYRKRVTEKEKEKFKLLQEGYCKGETSHREMEGFLSRINKKYPSRYMMESYFFD